MVQQQAEIEVSYKKQNVGVYYANLLVNQLVICELEVSEGSNER